MKRQPKRRIATKAKAASQSPLSPSQQRKLAKQESEAKEARRLEKPEAALRKYRPRKSEWGKLVFIGTKGNRDARGKGRKGWLVEISAKGKKSLVKDYRSGKVPNARLLKTIDPTNARSRKAKDEFLSKIRSRRVSEGKGRFDGMKKGSGKDGLSFGSNSAAVRGMTDDIERALKSGRGGRQYVVEVIVLLEKLEDGERLDPLTVFVEISRADHGEIRVTGVRHFVERKVYGELARYLASKGLVTAGSANHVASLAINRRKKRSQWKKPFTRRTKAGTKRSTGQFYLWEGHDAETVRILQMEWKIDQKMQ